MSNQSQNRVNCLYIIFQSIGPFIVDTTKPRFSGSNIDVNLINDFLIANWTADAFEDPDDPYPMYFKYAVGKLYKKLCHLIKVRLKLNVN